VAVLKIKSVFHPSHLVLCAHSVALVDDKSKVHGRQVFKSQLFPLDTNVDYFLLPSSGDLIVPRAQTDLKIVRTIRVLMIDMGNIGVDVNLLRRDNDPLSRKILAAYGARCSFLRRFLAVGP